jgi:hypothetical protein
MAKPLPHHAIRLVLIVFLSNTSRAIAFVGTFTFGFFRSRETRINMEQLNDWRDVTMKQLND